MGKTETQLEEVTGLSPVCQWWTRSSPTCERLPAAWDLHGEARSASVAAVCYRSVFDLAWQVLWVTSLPETSIYACLRRCDAWGLIWGEAVWDVSIFRHLLQRYRTIEVSGAGQEIMVHAPSSTNMRNLVGNLKHKISNQAMLTRACVTYLLKVVD
jgi:hypothetical protein